ncbi:MAG TPA: FAD-binding protein, partial [Candidatus Deferrimicrobiaceae bacterium]|nr:FAD-binding protein [Candidatus Deferrimicrobiaceae bacterium]
MSAEPASIWDVVIVGAGPAGLFAARALAGKLRVIVLEEKGRTGGAGAMTDGKLNLSPHIGLDLTELGLSETEAGERIAAIDEVFLEHGADRALYGVNQERINWWLDRVSWVRHRTAKGDWDITLVPARQRHMGTDLAHRVVARMTDSIAGKGVAFSLRTWVTDLALQDDG